MGFINTYRNSKSHQLKQSYHLCPEPMALQNLIFLFFSLLIAQFPSSTAQNVVKATYWFPDSGISASDINSSLFTHIFCAFADLNPQTNEVTISSNNQNSFSTFTSTVQQKSPSIKTLLSIGGGNSNASDFAAMASQASSRKTFIDSSISIARSYGFYGLDLDWESPRNDLEMSNMGLLLDEWRTAVNNESSDSPLLLTAAVYYSSVLDSVSFPVDSIGNDLDWINIMAYDYYMPSWSNLTGAHALLYDQPDRVSTSSGVDSWTGAGLSTAQMVLGMPYYGYAWKLVDLANHGIGAPATGPALSESGAVRYVDIKTFIQNNGATSVYNATVVANYCYSGTTWIGFDDVESIRAKVSYAKEKGLLGYFTWHVANDDNWVLSEEAYSGWT
ncbi:class V chitinase-like [Telopea speciosissima]|uniref:class V chitinase-like n=1 Tax=Telopea speciosissima TaxID=54955 RepID=UPI001CC6AC16|nr:class V chitinase-like [Telopea speciosissima]